MKSLDNLKLYSLLGLAFLLCSCSTSAVFPDIVEDDSNGTSMSKSKSLGSDEENVAYDDEGVTSNKYAEKITPAKTSPVVRESEATKSALLSDKPMKVDLRNKKGSKAIPTINVADAQDDAGDNIVMQEANYVPSMSYLADTIYFANGSSHVGPEYNKSIRNSAKLAKQHNATVTVYGYASSRTRNTDMASHKLANFDVSMKRAESVAKELRRAGVPEKNIKIEALSDSNPAYLEVMPEGERLNRRAEIYISY